ncbi:hypothetical protein DM860_000901 [Cuscuta australis]|uniref:HAT C-terminal dimerisation domain-containing protein n=1 Tax=Cuscuta australis TaxID=267555 RepID=A0A328DWL9_9ASTE|nr:hypothetical protein DM860_000901 [Cuscuta australis]
MTERELLPTTRIVVMLMKFFFNNHTIDLGESLGNYLVKQRQCLHGHAPELLVTTLCSHGRVEEALRHSSTGAHGSNGNFGGSLVSGQRGSSSSGSSSHHNHSSRSFQQSRRHSGPSGSCQFCAIPGHDIKVCCKLSRLLRDHGLQTTPPSGFGVSPPVAHATTATSDGVGVDTVPVRYPDRQQYRRYPPLYCWPGRSTGSGNQYHCQRLENLDWDGEPTPHSNDVDEEVGISRVIRYCIRRNNTSSAPKSKKGFKGIVGGLLAKKGKRAQPSTSSSSIIVSSHNELAMYQGVPCDYNDVEFGVLGWWKRNEHMFPCLGMLARQVLSIPVSTVAVEREFSAGGNILTDYQSSLNAESLETLVCNQDWVLARRRAQESVYEFNSEHYMNATTNGSPSSKE